MKRRLAHIIAKNRTLVMSPDMLGNNCVINFNNCVINFNNCVIKRRIQMWIVADGEQNEH